MSGSRRYAAAKIALAILTLFPQVSLAEGFTGKDFATWEKASQDSYIQTSVTMLGVVAAQVKPEIATCIDTRYFSEATLDEEGFEGIRDLVLQYKTYHPSGVIYAAIVQECGNF